MPLTVYGRGEQIRGFIGLEDAMQCMIRLICSPPEPGQYDVVNQVTGVYRIVDLAEMVAQVGKDFGLDVVIQRVGNPRVESDYHPMETVSTKLESCFGLQAKVRLHDEIRHMYRVLLEPVCMQRLIEKRMVVDPCTRWDGTKEKMEVLETYHPGKKIPQTMKQVLYGGKGYELESIQ